jgi:hypothetical protein
MTIRHNLICHNALNRSDGCREEGGSRMPAGVCDWAIFPDVGVLAAIWSQPCRGRGYRLRYLARG